MIGSLSSSSGETSNPFALALWYYASYYQSKLPRKNEPNNDFFARIIKKYYNPNNPAKSKALVGDLGTKYIFPVPEAVQIIDIVRICDRFSIPDLYIQSFPEEIKALIQNYDAHIDVVSDQFNAEKAFCASRSIISAYDASQCNVLDNMSKVGHLLPNSTAEELGINRSLSSRATDELDKAKESALSSSKRVDEDRRHFFEILADYSLQPMYNFRTDLGEEKSLEPPISLLAKFMRQRIRARIIIRRRSGVRGSMDAYIKAFDRYFNMVLLDVDEEYIANKQSKRALKMGKFVNQYQVNHRHWQQLILRGDNVVMVFAVPF